MGAETKIEWCHHTFNPWIGCTRVAPECAHCYAERFGDRFGVKWGPRKPRRRTSESNWRQPLAWDRAAHKAGVVRRVFCASLADVFDDAVPDEWRDDLFALIRQTTHLRWLLLTKHPGNILPMLAPDLHGNERIWLGTTVGHPDSIHRAETLADLPAPVLFLSMEPLLGPVILPPGVLRDVSWVIAGGESGPGARPMHPAWARSLRDQAVGAGVPFFFKQWGEWLPKSQGGTFAGARQWGTVESDGSYHDTATPWNGHDDDGPGAGAVVFRGDKKHNGRILDGRTWDEVPA